MENHVIPTFAAADTPPRSVGNSPAVGGNAPTAEGNGPASDGDAPAAEGNAPAAVSRAWFTSFTGCRAAACEWQIGR